MTFCLAMRTHDGIVGIADTRITSGSETITARKLTIHPVGTNQELFLMTSGLRSIRDKVVTYFEEVLAEPESDFDRLYKAVNALAQQVRAVAAEDREALKQGKLFFNLHCLIGGQLSRDEEPKLYLLYPQANWVEVSEGTPYFVIGETGYGKPLLDRMLRYETTMDVAMRIGYLAFDATQTSSSNVGFPIDTVIARAGQHHMATHRFEESELHAVSEWWQKRIAALVDDVPSDVFERALRESNLRRVIK